LLESVAVTLAVVVPAIVGVPVIEQFALSVRPAGIVLPAARAQVYGPVPPLTPTEPVYGTLIVPLGGEVIVRVVAALIVIDSGPVTVFGGVPESVALTVTVDVPAAVGVPLTRQFAPSMRPAGSASAVIAQEYGAVPPVTPIVCEYGVPTVPAGNVLTTSVSPALSIVIVSCPLTLLAGVLESVAFTVTVVVPDIVGVPLTVQPKPRISPAGSIPVVIVQEYGEDPPLTPIVAEYGVPTVPSGSVPFVSVIARGRIVIVSGPVVLCGVALESVAFTDTVIVPAVVGVPLTTQPAPSMRPDGSVPDAIVQVYGDVPPLTPIVAEYGEPTVPFGKVPTVNVTAVPVIVIVSDPVTLCGVLLESVAFTITVTVPAVVGVPLTEQFAPSESPAGKVPDVIAQEYGEVPPVTPIVAEYATPTVPLGNVPFVSVRVVPAALTLIE